MRDIRHIHTLKFLEKFQPYGKHLLDILYVAGDGEKNNAVARHDSRATAWNDHLILADDGSDYNSIRQIALTQRLSDQDRGLQSVRLDDFTGPFVNAMDPADAAAPHVLENG